MIASDKFEKVCKELELSLNREKQAEIMLNQQGVQLQDLSSKLAELSNTELNSFKLKEVKRNSKYEKKIINSTIFIDKWFIEKRNR